MPRAYMIERRGKTITAIQEKPNSDELQVGERVITDFGAKGVIAVIEEAVGGKGYELQLEIEDHAFSLRTNYSGVRSL